MKLYVEERGSEDVARAVEGAAEVATVRVSYAEARAAFARLERERAISRAERRGLVQGLDADWPGFNVVDVTETLVRRAGRLAERHGLRGYDAVQLAAALEVRDTGGRVEFGAFDVRLNGAARRERLVVLAFV